MQADERLNDYKVAKERADHFAAECERQKQKFEAERNEILDLAARVSNSVTPSAGLPEKNPRVGSGIEHTGHLEGEHKKEMDNGEELKKQSKKKGRNFLSMVGIPGLQRRAKSTLSVNTEANYEESRESVLGSPEAEH